MHKKLLMIVSEDGYFLSHRQSITKSLINEGYEITLLTYVTCKTKACQIQALGINLIRLKKQLDGFNFSLDYANALQIRTLVEQHQYSKVFVINIRCVFITLFALKKNSNIPIIGLVAGLGFLGGKGFKASILRTIIARLMSKYCRSMKVALIAQNRDDYHYLSQKIIAEERLKLILGSGVDLEHFNFCRDLSEDKFVVTFVGRLLKDKGVVDIVEASKMVADKGYSDIAFQIVGEIFPQNPSSIDQAYIEASASLPNLRWLGRRDDISKVYAETDVAILPSYYREGIPKSLIEAASCGCPLISTNLPGCSEVCIDGYNGVSVQAKSPAQIADAVISLYNDRLLCDTYSRHSRKLVESKMSYGIINSETISLINSLN